MNTLRPVARSLLVGCALLSGGCWPSGTQYRYAHYGAVSATGVFGAVCEYDFDDTSTFLPCQVKVLAGVDGSRFVIIGSPRAVAIVARLPWQVNAGDTDAEDADRSIRVGLFRIPSADVQIVDGLIGELWTSGGEAAVFEDPRCVPLHGSIEARTEGTRLLRFVMKLHSDAPVPPLRAPRLDCDPVPAQKRVPVSIEGTVREVREGVGQTMPWM